MTFTINFQPASPLSAPLTATRSESTPTTPQAPAAGWIDQVLVLHRLNREASLLALERPCIRALRGCGALRDCLCALPDHDRRGGARRSGGDRLLGPVRRPDDARSPRMHAESSTPTTSPCAPKQAQCSPALCSQVTRVFLRPPRRRRSATCRNCPSSPLPPRARRPVPSSLASRGAPGRILERHRGHSRRARRSSAASSPSSSEGARRYVVASMSFRLPSGTPSTRIVATCRGTLAGRALRLVARRSGGTVSCSALLGRRAAGNVRIEMTARIGNDVVSRTFRRQLRPV